MKIRKHSFAIIILTVVVLLISAVACSDETKVSRCADTSSAEDATLCKAGQGELIKGKVGFWRLKRDANGVWWFLSPEGKQEFLNTVTTVQPFQKGRDENGQHYVSKDYKGRTDVEKWNIDPDESEKDLDEWAAATIKRVKAAGFKNLGGWCQPVFHRHDVAVTRCLSVWSSVGKSNKLFYEPDWPQLAEEVIKNRLSGLVTILILSGTSSTTS